MRRPLIAALVIAILVAGFRQAIPAQAVTYSAGWNLVGGPAASTLTGATGNIYTLQPGDTDYESLPASTPLKACWGYWAYFPVSGTITFGPGTATCSATLRPGEWAMLGGPSTTGYGLVNGADSVLTYAPGSDYQQTAQIPVGQGAWVMGPGAVSVTVVNTGAPGPVTAGPGAPVSPAPAAAPVVASLPSTTASLRAVSLNAADLPGFILVREPTASIAGTGWLAAYAAIWSSTAGSRVDTVGPSLTSSPNLAHAQDSESVAISVITDDRTNFNVRSSPLSGLGDSATGITYNWFGSTSGTLFENSDVVFRRGTIVVTVFYASSQPGGTSLNRTAALAHTIDLRLGGTAASVPIAQPTSAAATNPDAPTPMCPMGFIPNPGNGGGPTLCRDGLCSHSAGPGTCSGHGGVAMRIGRLEVWVA